MGDLISRCRACQMSFIVATGHSGSYCSVTCARSEIAPDPIKHPEHYTFGAIEVWDAIEAWKLNFFRGNVVKYVARAGRKGDELTDLKKARQYLEKEIARLEKK